MLGLDENVGTILGFAGAVGVVIAVVTALFGGPVAGAVAASAGWLCFFFIVADEKLSTVVSLPLWIATAVLAGLVSRRLVQLERERAETRVADITAHGLRTPVATIHGVAQALRTNPGLSDETRQQMLDLIVEESRKLLEEEVRGTAQPGRPGSEND